MNIYEKDGGYTTFSMVVALLLTLSLIFTTAQVYRISTAAAAIQDVADAAALAAENQVAEFMIVARTCDAVILSLTLSALTVTGLGVAALCTPVTASASEILIDAGKKIMDARNSFAENAADGLNVYQKILPFLAAASATKVAAANETGSTQPNYTALALLLPGSGDDIVVEEETAAEEAQEAVDEESEPLQQAGEQAEEAARKANEAKQDAYEHDCGLDPDYCMYQRASSLAGMGGSSNPYYSSVDTWSFSAAFQRACAYYRCRLEQESPENDSIAEQARSVLRREFYAYAVQQMSNGYVYETKDTFEAYFPELPKNTEEMRGTSLYTDVNYPVTVNERGSYVMHVWEGCPEAGDCIFWGCISQMEDGSYETCPTCGFTAASMGQVASASTNIRNGFEYHYAIVADDAKKYQQAKAEEKPAADEVKSRSQGLFDQIIEALKEAADKRISPNPPGSDGAIVLVIDRSEVSSASAFENTFVEGSSVLGTRAAVSGATLLEDDSDEAKTVITSFLDDVRQDSGVLVGTMGVVLDVWSGMLGVYTDGQDAVTDAIEGAVSAIPFASQSGLGTWASKQFSNAVDSIGLQPAKLSALRAVTVNTGYVAGGCQEPLSVGFLAAKQGAIATGEENGLLGAALGYVRYAALGKLNDTYEIASIKPLGESGPSIPITIKLPAAVQDGASSLIEGAIEEIRQMTVGEVQVDQWR